MKQELENNNAPHVQTQETYEAPCVEVIEMEVEGPILADSGPDFGNGGRW